MITRLFVLSLIFAIVVSCKRDASAPRVVATAPPEVTLPDNFRELPPEPLSALLKAKPDLQIIDVRTETEWQEEGHLQGARLINFFQPSFRDHLGTLDPQKPHLVYCALGERARKTAALMAELGFKEVYLLQGGLNAWKKAKLPIARG